MMSENKLMRLQALRREIEELEADPSIKEHQTKVEQLKDICAQNGMTTAGAFSLLAPHIAGPKSSVKIPDYRRLPHRTESKLVLHRDLRLLKAKAEQLLERLEKDAEVKKRLAFIDEVAKLGLSPDYAAQLLDPQRFSKGIHRAELERGAKKKTATVTSSTRPKRYWRNPYTGQIVSGYSSTVMRIQRWKDEHGDEVVKGWEISEEEALKDEQALKNS